MKVLIVGSTDFNDSQPTGVPTREELLAFCDQLGHELAQREHTIVIGSTRPRTVDYHVLNGATRFARQSPTTPVHVKIHYREKAGITVPEVPGNLSVDEFAYSDAPGDRRTDARMSAIRDADVAVVIGGAHGTGLVATLAEHQNVPVVPVPTFGGTAARVYQRLQNQFTASQRAELSQLHKSTDIPMLIEVAEQLVKERLQKGQTQTHSYFLSYSNKDQEDADHIELLFRRLNRIVFRDEANMSAGSNIDSALQTAIEGADTFVVLLSDAYSASDWCGGELAHARATMSRSDRPSRIAVIELKMGLKPPLVLSNLLRLAGHSRTLRELAVFKLTSKEG
jgi:hypothetical protein